MTPRRFTRVASTRLRRKTSWAGGPGQTGITTVSASSIVTYDSSPEFEDGETFIRIRGSLSAYLTVATSAADGFHFAFGIALFTEQALVAGLTALQRPISDQSWEGWIYHRFFDIHGSSAGDVSSNSTSIVNHEVDSKAMRKTGSDMFLVAIMELVEAGVATAKFNFQSRILVKLP